MERCLRRAHHFALAHAGVAPPLPTGPRNCKIVVEALMDPLRCVAGEDVVRPIRQGIVDIIASMEQLIASKEQLIASKEQLIVAKEQLIVAKEQLLVGKDNYSATIERVMEHVYISKTSQLALHTAQFEPSIMVDTLWAALWPLEPLGKDDDRNKRKWGTLIRDVLNEGKLTAAAKADLDDLGGAAEEPTVINDLGSLSRLLSLPYYFGFTIVLKGTGWRIGTSPSPHLATALVLSANMRTLRKKGIESLRGDVIYLDRGCNETHRFDMRTLRWAKTRAKDP